MSADIAMQERELWFGHLVGHSLKSRKFRLASGLASSLCCTPAMITRIVPPGRISTASAPCSFAARMARATSASVNRAAVLLILQMHLHRYTARGGHKRVILALCPGAMEC